MAVSPARGLLSLSDASTSRGWPWQRVSDSSWEKPGKQKIWGKKDSLLCVTQDKKDSYQPVCNIPIITSLKEEERLIESSTKVLGPPRGRQGWEARGARSPALTLSPLTARCEAAIQQEQQQILLHQVGGAPVGAGTVPRDGLKAQLQGLSGQPGQQTRGKPPARLAQLA